jgi:dihydrofolate reductase
MPFHIIDEYRIMVNPVILGSGKPLFRTEHGRLNLTLIKTKPFTSGNVLLYYRAQSDEQTLNSHH